MKKSHFTFSVDGNEVVATETLQGAVDGENVEAFKVEFDIPANAEELTIVMGDGGDGIGCDHSAIGDAKLLTTKATAVEPANKLPTIWGHLKARY
ncbi:NPCBM/NEW2 domain-containing protein [Candidatus Poribacteria bacterium]|nr:NPCBM/NEW2 domain-containing protein [Candidatus Poribacteria bacterium]